MGLSDEIEATINAGGSLDSLNIPEHKLGQAKAYATYLQIQKAQANPALEAQTEAGAKARNELRRAEEMYQDQIHLLNQIGPRNIVKAPEMGFTTGEIIGKYEQPQDIGRFLEQDADLPEGAQVSAVTTRDGNTVWGYTLKDTNTFYRLTPDSLLESPSSVAGGLWSHPRELVGGMAGSMVPGGPLAKLTYEVTGATIGRVADEYSERQHGAQNEVPEIISKAGTTALLTGIVGGAMTTGQVVRDFRRAGEIPTNLTEVRKSAENVADVAEMPAYQPTLADRENASPAWKRIMAMYNSLYGAGEKNKRLATEGSRQALEEIRKEAADQGQIILNPDGTLNWDNVAQFADPDRLLTILTDMRNAVVVETRDKLAHKDVATGQTFMQHADKYARAVDQYKEAAHATLNKLYDAAFRYADTPGTRPVEFHAEKIPGVLREIEGIQYRAADGTRQAWSVRDIDPRVATLLDKFRNFANNQSFETIEKVTPPPPGTETLGMKAKRVQEERYVQASKVLADMKRIRSQLGDLMQPNATTGEHDLSSRIASKLYGALSEMMKDPVGGTPAFKATWKAANEMNVDLMQVSEFLDAGKLLDKATLGGPETITRELYQRIGSNTGAPLTLIKTLESRLPKGSMAEIRNGYVDRLLEDPAALVNKRWTEAETKLLSSDMRRDLQMHGAHLQRIAKGDVNKAMMNAESQVEAVKDLVLRTKPDRLKQTLQAAGIPEQAAQAAILSDILSKVVREENGKLAVNPASLQSTVRSLKSPGNSAKWNMLSEAQRKLVSDVDRLTSFVKKGDGIAVGLEAMKIESQRTKVYNPVSAGFGQAKKMWYGLLGKIGSNDRIVRLFDQAENMRKMNPNGYVRSLVIGSSLVADDLMNTYTNNNFNEAGYER